MLQHLNALELLYQAVQVQLAAVRDQSVALEAIDMNPRDRDFGAGRCHATELTRVGTGESASRYAMRTIDEDFFDDVLTIGEPPVNSSRSARHSSQPNGSELPTSTTTRGDTRASMVDQSRLSIAA